MKTSVIDVRDMLSVLSALGVEKRIGDVPGVESVTVNYAAGNATVRYDETRLHVADIKSDVRQRGYESATPAAASAGDHHESHTAPGAPPATPALKSAPDANAAAPASAVPQGDKQKDKAAPAAAASTKVDAAPKPSPAAAPASAGPLGDGQKDKATSNKS